MITGKVSWFGGPDDSGVAPDEGLAFIYDVEDAPQLFLSSQPPGTSGLARRLDPEVFYIACRWDYDQTPRGMLLSDAALVRSIKTGFAFPAFPADWGPHENTGRIADISPGLMEALGIETDDEVEVTFPWREPMSEIVKCIDISHWQDFPDFEEVKAVGVIAMIHKATEGTGYSDPNRGRNCKNAIDAGIAVATYHWLSPDEDATAQMEYYLEVVQPVQGERVVIDYEEEGCQLPDLIEAVKFLKADPRGLQVSIYSGHLLKEQISGQRNDYLAENTDLWLAQYTTGTPTWPDETYPMWTLWQYSESGNIDGIYGSEVDLNRFNGSDENLLKWINPAGGIAPPEPQPEPDAKWVDVEITTSGGVAVNVKVNDQPVQRRLRLRRGPDRK